MKKALLVFAICVLAGCGGGGEESESVMQEDVTVEDMAVIDEYTCTDEREQALEYAVLNGYKTKTAVPDLWDGTPFVVDVSSTFENAYELLDAIADESARIRSALGYEIFVAGEVIPLDDLQSLKYRSSIPIWAFDTYHPKGTSNFDAATAMASQRAARPSPGYVSAFWRITHSSSRRVPHIRLDTSSSTSCITYSVLRIGAVRTA